MDIYIEKLESALKAINIHSLSSFSWFSERETVLPAGLKRALPLQTLRTYFINILQLNFYNNFYCKGFATPVQSQVTQPPLASTKETFVNELSEANIGTGYQEDGWLVCSMSDSNIVVRKNDISFSVDKKDCVLPNTEQLMRTGISVSIRMPKELRFFSPGFYVALGDKILYRDDDSTIVRFYWNLGPEGAVHFVRDVTSAFNQASLAFRLKMVNHPARFTRCDSTILYIDKSDYVSAREILERIYPKLIPHLKIGTPVFAKPISFGLGIAEDPSSGASFGLHRCKILAEGIVRAFEQNQRTLNEHLETVINCFAENKINLEKPYLNPGSDDNYDFYPKEATTKPIELDIHRVNNHTANHQMFLHTAFEIGKALTQRAVWHDRRCNWLGLDVYGENRTTKNTTNLAYKSLGPDLYSGTSGIALFLAELQTAVDDDEIRRTSIGAIQQAISLAPKLLTSGHLGLYDGLIGIASVATYIGILLGEDQLIEKAAALLNDAIQNYQGPKHMDIISGNAGAIIALLMLQDILDNPSLLDLALRFGDELLHKAENQEDQCSWSSASFPKQRALTGFSHGTAGIGYALVELSRMTADLKYLNVAELAFNYERKFFDEEMSNWPDFRGVSAKAKPNTTPFSFPVSWCHGAPGIALSRLRAYQILKDEKYKSEALIALRTTMKWTKKMLGSGAANFSLCHGLAGNAEILFHGSQVLQHEFIGGFELAEEVAITGISRYAERNQRWPFGTLGDKSPGLMLGLSGVGYFYLRLHNPATPSFLIFENEKILQRLSSLTHK